MIATHGWSHAHCDSRYRVKAGILHILPWTFHTFIFVGMLLDVHLSFIVHRFSFNVVWCCLNLMTWYSVHVGTVFPGEGGESEGVRDGLGALEVTAENIAVNLRVIRGPDWNWGDEDGGEGGEGKTGVILSFDKAKAIAQVLWEGGQAHKHYRFGAKSDLIISTGAANCALGRRNSQLFFASKSQTLLIFDWDDTLFPTTYVLWLDFVLGSLLRICLQQKPKRCWWCYSLIPLTSRHGRSRSSILLVFFALVCTT